MFWPFKRNKDLPERDFILPEGVRIYAIGDIHGRFGALKKLMHAIDNDAKDFAGEQLIEVFLGDYIDRGMYSKQVIEYLSSAPKAGRERICLRGNHEQTLLDFLDDAAVLRSWIQFGGLPTLDAYGVSVCMQGSEDNAQRMQSQFCNAMPEAHLRFFKSLNSFYECGDYYFVHAGIRPEVPLEQQQPDDQLWIRGDFLNHRDYFEKYIVHGHTPSAFPQLLHHRANLDVSDADEQSLCALCIEGSQRKIIQVSR